MTESSPNTEPQLLLESGPMLLRDFNPRGALRFQGRLCVTCGGEIMGHWLRDSPDPELKGLYWCSKDGERFSEGIEGCTVDLAGVRAPQDLQHTKPSGGQPQ